MRKFLVGCLFVFALWSDIHAWQIPRSNNGVSPANLDMIGGVATMVDQSTTPALAANTTGWVLAIWLSSGIHTNFANLRDSGTANVSSALFLPPLQYGTSAQIIEFENPPSFTNGLSVNIDSTVACAVVVLQANDTYVYFLPMSDNNVPAQDTALMGVSVSTVNQTTTAIMVATSPISPALLYGFWRSTGTADEYIEFRDTATANTTSALLLPKIPFSSDMPYNSQGNKWHSLKYPVRFKKGMSVNASVATRLISVFYRRPHRNRPK